MNRPALSHHPIYQGLAKFLLINNGKHFNYLFFQNKHKEEDNSKKLGILVLHIFSSIHEHSHIIQMIAIQPFFYIKIMFSYYKYDV